MYPSTTSGLLFDWLALADQHFINGFVVWKSTWNLVPRSLLFCLPECLCLTLLAIISLLFKMCSLALTALTVCVASFAPVIFSDDHYGSLRSREMSMLCFTWRADLDYKFQILSAVARHDVQTFKPRRKMGIPGSLLRDPFSTNANMLAIILMYHPLRTNFSLFIRAIYEIVF